VPAEMPLSPAYDELLPSSSLSYSHKQVRIYRKRRSQEPVLDAEQCIVFRDTLAACRRAGLDLTSTECDDQIRDQSVLRFARAVGDHDTPAIGLCELRT